MKAIMSFCQRQVRPTGLVLLALFFSASLAQAEATMHVWFEVKPLGSGVVITPFLEGSNKDVLRYELESENHTLAGNSLIRQSGGVRILRDHPTPITQLRMNPTQSGSCEVTLRLFDDGHLIAEKTLTDCRPSI